jgi:hypothetical protein
MMHLIRLFLLATFYILLVSSCKFFNNSDDVAIAKAYNKYLYLKDLEGIVPQNSHGNDSILIVKAFVNQWLKEQAIQHQAEENIKLDNQNIEKQLEVYKRSLIRFNYEQNLIAQKLDTIVTDNEIATYYQKNKSNFELRKPILKASYIKLPIDAPKIGMVKNLFVSKDLRDIDLLEKYCFKYSPNFSLQDTAWHYLDELEQILPINTVTEGNNFKLNRIFEITENNTLYLLILRDSKYKDSLSPIAFERDNIKNLILNQRKLTLINQMERSVFDEAQKNKELEVYDK